MRYGLNCLLASACMAALVGAAHADTFINGSFENGALSGWTLGGGSWYGGAYPTPADYLPGGSHYDASQAGITVTSAGLDPYTDNNLRLVYAGNHSARVNDPINNYSVSVISQRVNNYTDPLIAFSYAAVLQQSHGATDSDAFIVTLTDATTNDVLYSYNLNSATAPSVFTRSSSYWYYTDWIAQSIDVSTRSGHDFILSLLANDCPYGGHAGYAYLDGFGSTQGGGGTGGGAEFLYWDGDGSGASGNGVVDGGTGVWSVVNTNFTEATGATNGVYTPQPGSVIFSGQPGVVTVNDQPGAVAVTGMQFAVDGYRVQGDAITLSGTDVVIQVGDGTSAGAGYTATIASALTGTAGLTKTDLGTLVLTGANTYSGDTTVADGTLIGSATSFGAGSITDNARLIIDQPTDASLANPIDGSSDATFIKTGAGALTLTGIGLFAGSTEVQAGRLQVDGALASSTVTVQNGGALGGNGTVGAVVAQAGSTVAPGAGASNGALTVNNNYSQASGSTYRVNADTAGGSDQVFVNGDATLAGGAELHLVKTDPGHFILGTRYTVLSTGGEGGLSGRFVLSGDTRVSTFVDVVDHYDPSHAYLDVVQTHSFASVGQTPNQIAAAGGADSGSGALFNAIVYLQTADEARVAFDAISGEIHAQVKSAGLEDSRFIREAVLDRLRTTGDSGDMAKGVWGRAFGSWGHADSDGNAASYNRDIGGFFMGADLAGGETWRGGVVGGYSHSTINGADRASRATTDDYHLGGYAGTRHGPVGVRFGGAYTWRQVHTDRTAAFTGFSNQLNADYDADVGQVFAEIDYRLGDEHANIEPLFNVAYANLHSNALAETGGPAAVTGQRGSVDAIFTTVGARGSTAFNVEGAPVKLHALAGWRHADSEMSHYATLAFVGGVDFRVAGLPIARNALAMEAGAEVDIGHGGAFDISYSGQVADRVSDHGVKATLSWKF